MTIPSGGMRDSRLTVENFVGECSVALVTKPRRDHGNSKAYRARKKAEIIGICESYLELLEAAKMALHTLSADLGHSNAYTALRTAIAKAEGEAL